MHNQAVATMVSSVSGIFSSGTTNNNYLLPTTKDSSASSVGVIKASFSSSGSISCTTAPSYSANSVGDSESRPVNVTVKLWKRTA